MEANEENLERGLGQSATGSATTDEAEVDALRRMNVPGDGSCLFWAVTMAYLLPVRHNLTSFSERFVKLFSVKSANEVLHVRKLLQNDPHEGAYEDHVLAELVTNVLRNRVVDQMLKQEAEVYESVTLDDFVFMRNEAFIVDGAFRERFLTQFPSESHLIDLNRLKPNRLDEKSIDLMDGELDKISDKEKVQKFKFRTYLESMRNRKCWAGPLEIKAIQWLIKCKILLINENFNYSMIKNGTNILLFLINENHYNFGLVKSEIAINAIKSVNYRLTSRLIKLGVDNINYQDDIGWTVLHYATTTDNHDDLICHLVNQGANLGIKNKDSKTALELAQFLNQQKSIKALTDLEQGISQFEETEIEGKRLESALKEAAINNKSIKLINNVIERIENEVDVERSEHGNLAHKAVKMGILDLVKIFVVKGQVEVDVKFSFRRTLLQTAVEYGHVNVVKFLIEHGADVNSVDATQKSVLTSGVMAGDDHIVDYLLVKGADVNTLDRNRMSPLHHAVLMEQWNMVTCLVEHKAHLNMVDDQGETPLSMAIKRGNWDIAKYLLENGALLVGLSEETKRDIYQRFIAQLKSDFQLHQAIALGNVELLETLITSVPIENETLFEVYNEHKVQNVRLSSNICIFIENKLMDFNYYSDSKLTDEPIKETLNIDNVKKRLSLVVSCIDRLLIDYSIDKEVSDSFVFIGKFVAKNMQILKRDLSVTRDVIPWEEMQFCLINFLFRFIEPTKIDSTMTLVLNRSRLMRHLSLFKGQLEKLDIDKLDFSKKLIKQRNLIRINLISSVPEFKYLFDDFEQLRDLHSLIKMEFHLKVACSVDLKKEPEVGQLVIERALQVTGECLKNTADSPNLSDNIHDQMFNFAVTNAKNTIVTLRDALSHVESLMERVKMEKRKSVKYLKKIQKDLMNFAPEITKMVNLKKIDIVKSFLKKIIDCETIEEIESIVRDVEMEDAMKGDVGDGSYAAFKTIGSHFVLLRKLSEKSADFPKELFDRFDEIIDKIQTKNREFQKIHTKILSEFKEMFELFKRNKDVENFQRGTRYVLTAFPFGDTDANDLYLKSLCLLDTLHKVMPKIWRSSVETLKLALKLYRLVNYETRKMDAIEEYKLKLNEKRENKLNSDESIALIDEQLLLYLNAVDDVYLKSEIGEEYETKKDIFQTKIKLIEFYEQKIELEESEFSVLLKKINFRLLKKEGETSSILFNEKDKSKCEQIIKRINRTNDSIGQLVKTLTEKPDSDVTKLFKTFFESFKSAKKIDQCFKTEDKKRIKDSYVEAYFQKLKTLEVILNLNQSDSELIDRLRSNAELRLAVEMLVLTLTEILENVSMFQTNRTFLDDSIPVLIGKHLRNYLAHGDLLIDLLSIDHLKSIVYHIRNIQKNSSQTESIVYNRDNRIGKTVMENIDKLEIDYKQNLESIIKREKLFIDIKQSDLSLTKALTLSALELKYRNCNGWTLLHYVAQTDHLDLFKVVLNDHLNIYYRYQFGHFILYYLVKFNSKSILKYIIDYYNIDPNVVLRKRQSMLHVSAEFGHLELTQWLLSIGVNVNDTDDYGLTPLHLATMNQHLDVVSTLIKHDYHTVTQESDKKWIQIRSIVANKELSQLLINLNDSKFFLLEACKHGYLDSAKFLLENSVDVNAASPEDGVTALHFAAEYGQTKMVEFLLDKGADVNRVANDGQTALHGAAIRNNLDVAQLLIERGAEVNAETEEGRTPLISASIAGNADIASLLLTNGANISCKFRGSSALYYSTIANHTETFALLLNHYFDAKLTMPQDINDCLHYASSIGNVKIMDMLLSRGFDVNLLNKNKSTPLHLAVTSNKAGAVETLLSRGADVNACDENGDTPLHLGALNGHVGILKLLMSRNVEFRANRNGDTPLHVSLFLKNDEIAEALVKKYPDKIDERDRVMKTALHIATWSGNSRMVDTLLKYKANVNSRNDDCKTSLHYAAFFGYRKIVETLTMRNAHFDVNDLSGAAFNGHTNVVKLLLKLNKSIINNEDVNNETPLHKAIRNGHLGTARVLLDNGADVNCRSKYNMTPLHVGVKNGNCRLVKLLLDKGSDVNAEWKNNITSLNLAVIRGHHRVVKLLVERGAKVNERESKPYFSFFGAIHEGHVAIVNTLIRHGADVNVFNDGMTPLHLAVQEGHKVIVEVLLKRGANTCALDVKWKRTPLHWIVIYGQPEMIKVFRRRKVYMNMSTLPIPTPLEMAIESGHAKCIIYLLIFGADVNCDASNSNLLTTLMISQMTSPESVRLLLNHQFKNQTDDEGDTKLNLDALNKYVEVAQLLVKCGSDVDSKTRLMWAAKEGNVSVIKFILQYEDVDINSRGVRGHTALHLAIIGGHFEAAETLIQSGADVFAKNDHESVLHLAVKNDDILRLVMREMRRDGDDLRSAMNQSDGEGDTPLMWAVENGRLSAAELLLNSDEIDVNKQNDKGWTALHWSAHVGHLEIVNLLINHKADANIRDANGETAFDIAYKNVSSDDKYEVVAALILSVTGVI